MGREAADHPVAGHPAIELFDLFGLQSLALLRFEIPSHSAGDALSRFHTGHLLKAVGVAGDSTATVKMVDIRMLDVKTREGQAAVAEAYAAGEGADMKVHLPPEGGISPKSVLAKLAQMGEAEQDSLIRAFIGESAHGMRGVRVGFRYLALSHAAETGGDLKNKHAHVDMRSYLFTNDADCPHGDIKFVLEHEACGGSRTTGRSGCQPMIVKIWTAGERVTRHGFTGATYHEYNVGDLLLELRVLPRRVYYTVEECIVHNDARGSPLSFLAPPARDDGDAESDEGSDHDAEEAGKHGIALVYTHNQVVPRNIAVDVLQNESAQNVFYGLGDRVTPETDGHWTALSHKIQQVVANDVLPTYGKLRAITGHAIDIAKLKGDGLRVQAKLLAAMSADDELMHAGMLVELVPRERYFERHPFGTAPFVSLESLQARSFAFVTGMLDGMPELELPKWDRESHGSRAAPVLQRQFNKLAGKPNGPWHQRVVGKLRAMFPDASPEDREGTDGNEAMWSQGLIRRKHRVAKYPEGYRFRERAIVPLASIVRGNYMHEAGAAPRDATDFVNRPLQYVHFDAPKPARDGGMDHYGLNTQEGLAKIARLRRDWPLQHMLAVPQIGRMVREVAAARQAAPGLESGVIGDSAARGHIHRDWDMLMRILARDMLKETEDQEIFNRLFVREALNVWTDVTPPEALTRDYLRDCGAYGSEEELNAALAETNGRINPGNRLALMDASTLSDLEYPDERTDLIMKNPRFVDLAAEAKEAYVEDPEFREAHASADMGLLVVADTERDAAAKRAQAKIRFDPRYPKLPQYPSSVLNKALSTHRWYMAEESKAGDGFLMYLDESPHTATFESSTHPRLSVETRVLIVDILDKA